MIDEQLDKTRAKITHLTFEDWLEGICRLAGHKSLPTDEELKAAGDPCAGLYLRQLKDDNPDAYTSLINERA